MKTTTINGFTIEKFAGVPQLGYKTSNGSYGRGRKLSGFSAVDMEGYSRQFETKREAVSFAENYG